MEKADLFVLACGRNNFLAAALMRGGFGSVPATKLTIEVHYTTRTLAQAARFKGECELLASVFRNLPTIALGFELTPIENDEWIVTLGGRFDQRAPRDLEGFRAFASSLTATDIAERICDATLLQPLCAYRMNVCDWYHYDRMKTCPGG